MTSRLPRGRLLVKLLAAMLVPAALALALFGAAAHEVARRVLEEEMGRRLATAATSVAMLVLPEQLSAIARVSVRSLFRQFKKDRGHSPAEFARKVRLDRARNMLEAGIEGTTVTQVALRCGFQNAGHFAREFRLAFGELPSETLRRGQHGRRG